MAEYLTTDTDLESVADAIRAKGGTIAPLEYPDGFISAIGEITGNPNVPEKEVNFRDYDGTIVYSYTPEEFLALEAMPENPDRTSDGLTAQGWNWSFSNAQNYVQDYGRLEIGQMYVTTDGKTHLYIRIPKDAPIGRRDFQVRWTQTVSQGVTIDWGDGSNTETFTGTSATNHAHTYSEPGDYEITLEVTSGTISFVGSNSQAIYGPYDNSHRYYCGLLRAVKLGNNITAIGDYAFQDCFFLETITVPVSVTSLGTDAFRESNALRFIVIPSGVKSIPYRAFNVNYAMPTISLPYGLTSIGEEAFASFRGAHIIIIPNTVTTIGKGAFLYTPSIDEIIIPNSVTTINSDAFGNCMGLKTVNISSVTSLGGNSFSNIKSLVTMTIPKGISTINSYTFQTDYCVKEYHFERTTPPTLSNTNAFNGIASDCVMYVPYSEDHSILNAYKAATNWSYFASKMQEEPE